MLQKIFPFILLFVTATGVLRSFNALRVYALSADAKLLSQEARLSTPRAPDGRFLMWSKEAEAALNQSIRAATLSKDDRDIGEATSWLREKARIVEDPTAKIGLLCKALHFYGIGLTEAPHNSDLLLGWSSTRQLLSSVNCPEAFTSGKLGQMVAEAIKWNPFEHRIVFGAGLLNLWSGDRDTALELFKRLITYSKNISKGEEALITSEIKTANDLLRVVPAHFPQAVYWSRAVAEFKGELITAWAGELRELQMQAMLETKSRMTLGKYLPSLYERDLRVLLTVSATDDVRREVDRELAALTRGKGDEEAWEFFSKRAALKKLEIIPSAIPSDTRVTAPFVAWGGDEIVHLDDFNQSLGFYLGNNQGVSLIVLRSLLGRSKINVGTLRIFGSVDNEHWVELTPLRTSVVELTDEVLLGIEVPVEAHKYWKVHNSSPQRERTFGAHLQTLITVYGQSVRDQSLRVGG